MTTLEPTLEEHASPEAAATYSEPFGALAAYIKRASTGDRAALARLKPDALQPHQLAALARALSAAGLAPEQWHADTWPRWALIAHGMALAGHDGKQRLPYGDAIRTRISSQCLKRHWRVAEDHFSLASLGVPMAVRSRVTLDLIRRRLMEGGLSEALAQAAGEGLRDAGLLDKGGKESKGKDALETGQAVLMGYAEIDYLVKRCAELAQENTEAKVLKTAIAKFLKEEKKNIEALKHGSG